MSRPEAKGWCPGAYRPMMSGDGLVVRVRPMMARLARGQILGLCDLATRFGSGLIDLTSRANLQIRGVDEKDHEALLQELAALELLPDDPALEGRRNILVSPLWQTGDETYQLASELTSRLAELPEMPAKVGYAIDLGPTPLFAANSADFRFERAETGLILRADGCATGRPVTLQSAFSALLEMAEWFVSTGGAKNRRMSAHVAQTPLPSDWQSQSPNPAGPPLAPGRIQGSDLYGCAFGQVVASELRSLVERSGASALRVTPWRLLALEGAAFYSPDEREFITEGADPLLQVHACPGAPYCTAATVSTRRLAPVLVQHFDGPLHISGCAKGCAHPRKCRTTLVGRNGAFDLVRNGLPWDEPQLTGLAPDTLTDRIGDD